ncbi:MAG: universal stress protein UspA [Frankiales bacterium]|nr:universal stress protein UspA [Frankiales bacterium]
MSGIGKVVVGVDGTAHSDAAVRWAADQVRQFGGTLHLVHAYVVPGVPSVGGALRTPEQRAFSLAHAEKLLHRARKVAGPEEPIEVTTEAVRGHAVDVLPPLTEGAELLVLGRHSGWSRLHRVGSVVDGCLTRAVCPVVVVPESQGVELPLPQASDSVPAG